MSFRAAVLLLAVVPAACGERVEASAEASVDPSDARAWTIGPVIAGRNYSHGMPLRPTPGPGPAWHIDLPRAPASAHYVTFRHGPLTGKSRIVMRYRIDADPGVRIVPRTAPAADSIITLYFQRRGDNWSAAGRYEAYRWYATFSSHSPIRPGVHELVAPLDGNWTAVMTSSARTNPAGFRDALANADQVGFVLGGGEGYGKGVHATGRARLTVLEFRVE